MDQLRPRFEHRIRHLARNPKSWLVVLLLLLATYRLTLIDRGHFYWGDERCYQPTFTFVDAVAAGNWRQAAIEMVDSRKDIPAARPGFVLLSVLPVLAQRAINPILGIPPTSLRYYDVASGFNVLDADAPHPEVLLASGYEGRKPWERTCIRDRQYKMSIYKRSTPTPQLTSTASG